MGEIAGIYGVGETVVHKRIHEYGIELKGVGKVRRVPRYQTKDEGDPLYRRIFL
jgi:hypothetical protein